MSLTSSHVKWKVEGHNWSQVITDSIDCLPIEIATRVIENTHNLKGAFNTSNNEYVLGLGIILMVSHDKMKSPDEIFVCHTPTILANAGFYTESELLQNMIDKLLKH